ncbi:MAG: GxxExxY protein [Crocinitomicaceae bacterium]|jgi:GxxExxY protein|nr:GxxExxY protein [Crocinitomicaceae bacterium]MDP4865088.1 GxxExxY protein [Crocinitomicaceae bacterium]MDP5010149.1 GxxExxY protein [Crocinitomicaceae bacterium]MDP5099419.1 GxxExxY protein [Crocinitomicaceae bacterium]
MKNSLEEYNQLTYDIIECCIEVHKELGPGLLESIYEECLESVLVENGLKVQRQVEVPLFFKGKKLNKGFRLDMLINDSVILELKSVETILPIHEAQLVSYLKLSKSQLGLLVNFNSKYLKDGVRRRINGQLS